MFIQDKTRQDKTRQTNYGFLAFRKVKPFLSVIPAKAGIYTNKSHGSRIKSGVIVVLILSLILNSLFIIPASVYAVSSLWTQTDWSDGSGQTRWSNPSKCDTMEVWKK